MRTGILQIADKSDPAVEVGKLRLKVKDGKTPGKIGSGKYLSKTETKDINILFGENITSTDVERLQLILGDIFRENWIAITIK